MHFATMDIFPMFGHKMHPKVTAKDAYISRYQGKDDRTVLHLFMSDNLQTMSQDGN